MAERRTRTRSTRAGRKIIGGLTELLDAVRAGEDLDKRFPTRTVEIADPVEYTPARVKATRRRLEVSQRQFARMLGVSPELVEHWEQGRRTPAPVVRRLLDEVNHNPHAFLERVGVNCNGKTR